MVVRGFGYLSLALEFLPSVKGPSLRPLLFFMSSVYKGMCFCSGWVGNCSTLNFWFKILIDLVVDHLEIRSWNRVSVSKNLYPPK